VQALKGKWQRVLVPALAVNEDSPFLKVDIPNLQAA
jgi:hypothetical protein